MLRFYHVKLKKCSFKFEGKVVKIVVFNFGETAVKGYHTDSCSMQ